MYVSAHVCAREGVHVHVSAHVCTCMLVLTCVHVREGVRVYVSAHVCAREGGSACVLVLTCVHVPPCALLPAFFFATKAHRAADGFVAHLWEPCPRPSKAPLLPPLQGLPETHTASPSRAVPSQPLGALGCQRTGKRE